MTMDGAGVVPVMDINRGGYGDGYGCAGGMGFLWIIVLFALLGGGWGNGFGGRNGAGLTQVEMQQGFDTQSTLRKLDGIQSGLCDGFYAQNTTMLQGFNGVNSAIAESRFAAQQCCCETNRNIDAVRAENYRNTCEITNAIHAEGEATRALLTQNTIQELRDQLQAAQLQLGNVAQTTNIINAVRPFPQPAYITCSPYTAANGYGCVNSCGC